MPLKNGFDIQKYISSNPLLCRVPLIFVSTTENKNEVDALMKMGAKFFLPKPVNDEALLKILKDIKII